LLGFYLNQNGSCCRCVSLLLLLASESFAHFQRLTIALRSLAPIKMFLACLLAPNKSKTHYHSDYQTFQHSFCAKMESRRSKTICLCSQNFKNIIIKHGAAREGALFLCFCLRHRIKLLLARLLEA